MLLYFLLFIFILYYAYDVWRTISSNTTNLKESFVTATNTPIESNGFVASNSADYSEHVLKPPPLKNDTVQLTNPALVYAERQRLQALATYNDAVSSFQSKLEDVHRAGDITLRGIQIIQGDLFPRYIVVLDAVRRRAFFDTMDNNTFNVADKSEEERNRLLTPYNFMFNNLALAGAANTHEIEVMRDKIVAGIQLEFFTFLAKVNIRSLTDVEHQFLLECMKVMGDVTPNGIASLTEISVPELNMPTETITRDNRIYAINDISDPYINPGLDNPNIEQLPYSLANERINAFCQREWYECHSHIPPWSKDLPDNS